MMETGTQKKKTPFVKQGQTKGPLLENILSDVARHYKTTNTLIRDKSLYGTHVLCRKLYCYIAYKITNATMREIGAVIGKDHSTVVHHKDRVTYLIKKGDPKFIDEWLDYLEGTELWGAHEKLR